MTDDAFLKHCAYESLRNDDIGKQFEGRWNAEMNEIDEKTFVADPCGALTNASTMGGAIIVLNNGLRVAVIDGDVWNHLQTQLPSIADFAKSVEKSR